MGKPSFREKRKVFPNLFQENRIRFNTNLYNFYLNRLLNEIYHSSFEKHISYHIRYIILYSFSHLTKQAKYDIISLDLNGKKELQ